MDRGDRAVCLSGALRGQCRAPQDSGHRRGICSVDILVWAGDDPETYTDTITDSVHVFTNPSYREPKLVIFDKGSQLLKTGAFAKPASQWIEQLLRAGDAADRVAAVHELCWTVDTPAGSAALVEALLDDRFWGVCYEAALALADSKLPIGEELVPGYGDRDARVRGAVIRALGNFRGDLVVRTLRHAFDGDSSYVVAENALRGLVKADSAGSLQACLGALSRVALAAEIAGYGTWERMSRFHGCARGGVPPQRPFHSTARGRPFEGARLPWSSCSCCSRSPARRRPRPTGTAPGWRARRQWPQLTLVNHIEYADASFPVGGCAFLIETEDGVVAGTTKHVLFHFRSKIMTSVSFEGMLKSWTMSPKNRPEDAVVVDRLVNENADEDIFDVPSEIDWLLFTVAFNITW